MKQHQINSLSLSEIYFSIKDRLPYYPGGCVADFAWRISCVRKNLDKLLEAEFNPSNTSVPNTELNTDAFGILNIGIINKQSAGIPEKEGNFVVECELIQREVVRLTEKVGKTIKEGVQTQLEYSTLTSSLTYCWTDKVNDNNSQLIITLKDTPAEKESILRYFFSTPPKDSYDSQLLRTIISGELCIFSNGCFEVWIDRYPEDKDRAGKELLRCDSYIFDTTLFSCYTEEDYHYWILPLFGLIEEQLNQYLEIRATPK